MNTPLKNELKSLIQRMLNDAATGVMFEADGDTLRAAISLCDEIQEHKKTIRKLSDEVANLTAERDELLGVLKDLKVNIYRCERGGLEEDIEEALAKYE